MKTTINGKLRGVAVALLSMLIPATVTAQDKFEISLGTEVVSKYVWRGFDQASGTSVQPSLGLAYKGISLSAWGSTSVTDLEPKELDLTLAYGIGRFGIAVTDYWWSGESGKYGHYKESHYFEGALSYNFGDKVPLTLSAAMMFAGADKNPDGDQNFSAYFNAAYDIACPGKVTLTPSVGISTKSYMYTGEKISGFTDISLKAAKEVKVTDSFLIPIFVQFIVSPVMDKTYLIFGMSF